MGRHKNFTGGSFCTLSQAEVALGWQVQMTTPRRPGMTIQAKILGVIALSGLAAFAMSSQANALTAQECSAKYQAAKSAGTLGGQQWNDFRKGQCGADATAAPAAAAPAAAAQAPGAEPKEA